MDIASESSQYVTSRRRHARDRTTSLTSVPHHTISQARNSALRNRVSVASMRSLGSPDAKPAEIVSPVPRRHLLQTSESLQWLRTRGVSPVSPTSSTGSSFRTASANKTLSFTPRGMPTSGSLRRGQEEDREDKGAARRWIRWMHRHNMKGWVVPCAIAASVCIKWGIGLGGYSGHATPPMFGDYEAQRHWMELTIHLPIQQWYTYDLQYWGLDYPPLTAYVSWICGRVGSWIDPSWFALETSRGIETPGGKLFMRATVLIFDALVYIPALYAFTRTWHGKSSSRTQQAALVTLLFHPALLLVDFGHFQYNSVMLVGLDLVGAVFFVLSLCFKQMSLYYAPVVGSYLLGKCIYLGPVHGVRLFIRLAMVTILSFIILFAPFLPPFAPFAAFGASISRIFPFARGLFEDKVKWKRAFDGNEALLVKASVALTALGFFPAVAGLLYGSYKTRLPSPSPSGKERIDAPATSMVSLDPPDIPTPTLPLLPYALLTTSMSFFLFSFQVHEKTILLPLLPLTLLLSGVTPGDEVFSWGALGNVVGVFSMWPLLKKDGLGVQYISMLIVWCRLIGYNPFLGLLSTYFNVLVSTPVFGLIWLWSIKRGIEVSWAMGGLPGSGTVTGSGPDAKDKGSRETGVRRDTGVRAMSLGYASGQDASGGALAGRGYRDPRRRALERLSLRAGSVEEER
ncbi:glycosyltransferase family 57 protein [Melanogaster broomeanus]|nr:glycosyltransferase family 57 protein [Melanogaster broomeanus]